MAMTLVSTVTVGSGGAASIEWTSIPQTGKDLLVVFSLRSLSTFPNSDGRIEFNGTTTNYSSRFLQNYGGSITAGSDTNSGIMGGNMQGNNATANTFGNGQFYISNYTSSAAKSISTDSVGENNATNQSNIINAGLWNNTAAITSIKLTDIANLVQHSTASLYIIS